MTITVSEDMSTNKAPAPCSVAGCPNDARARGMCNKHYRRWNRHGSTADTRATNKGKSCSLDGCPNPAKTRGMCEMHYARWRLNNGDVGDPAPELGVPVFERAMRMVDDSAGPDACHPWTGAVNNGLPTIYDGGREGRTTRSVRRVIAHEVGLLPDVDDKSQWIRMPPTCDPLCCNIEHMEVTSAGRPGTRKDS